MENNVLLPQAANVSDRMPRKRVPQPARMSFSGYTIDSECTSWEPIGGICKPASWGGAPVSRIEFTLKIECVLANHRTRKAHVISGNALP